MFEAFDDCSGNDIYLWSSSIAGFLIIYWLMSLVSIMVVILSGTALYEELQYRYKTYGFRQMWTRNVVFPETAE
jgi:Ca2+-dependent lipid-binding protein